MLDRLKSYLKTHRLENRASLAESQVSFLAGDLGPLDQVDRGLAGRALRYVVDGEDAGVLLDLAGRPNGAQVLQLRCSAPHGMVFQLQGSRPEMLGAFKVDEAPVALRLAQVYEAASRQGRRQLQLGWLGAPDWLEVFLGEALPAPPRAWESKSELRAEVVEAMLAADEADTSLPARGALLADPADWSVRFSRRLLTSLSGIGESIARHPGVVVEAMSRPAAIRATALEVMGKAGIDAVPFAEVLVDQAVSSAKTVREAAEPLVTVIADAARPLLRDKAENGNGGERDLAVRLIWRLDGDAARPFLDERGEKDPSKKVRQTVRELLGDAAAGQARAEADLPPLAPLAAVEPEAPLPKATCDALRELFKGYNKDAGAIYLKEKRRGNKYVREPIALPARLGDEVWRYLQSWVFSDSSEPVLLAPLWNWGYEAFERRIKTFLERPEIELIHFVRLMALIDVIHPGGRDWGLMTHGISPAFDSYARQYRRSHPPAFGLRELAAAFRAAGLDDRSIGLARLQGNRYRRCFLWEDEAVWPYFAERLDLVEEAFEMRPQTFDVHAYFRTDVRRNAFQILSAFPSVPARFHPFLWEIALGTAKSERPLAQAALETVQGCEPRIVAALTSGKQEIRAEAALWLARLGHRESVPHLHKALAKEKHDAAQGAFLTALERLGEPIEAFLDRDGLAGEAAKGLAKGIPAQLAWFPFDLLPAVHWADSGETVSPDVARWLLVRSFRLKSPEPGPLLRRYCSLIRREEREALGHFVLTSWIAQDTIMPTVDEVADEVRQQAKQWLSYYRGNPDIQIAEEQLYQRLLAARLEQCNGSAIKEKGILAVAGATCGAAAAVSVEPYLKRWYGKRAAQCKALLLMLSWVDHPSATQLVLSVANRFRTASIRKEAESLAQDLAERRGWTVAELADRTVPTAGFEVDESGAARLALDCGERRFTATLGEKLEVVLRSPEGKVVKSLPGPRKDEDPELIKRAKKQLSAAKKELKSVVALQRDRLYEAMCTQRGWSVEDWRTYLAGHPIVGRFCQRLVWAAFEDSEGSSPAAPVATFRLLDDGSLTDAGDDEVALAAGLVIRLAHDCNTPADTGRTWLAHLADYEVEPLFAQFGRDPFRLAEDKADETALEDFEGHLIEAFKLRSEATRLGYVRGKAEDAGWFYSYYKHFPTLELEAVLEFTGNVLPEGNRLVALRSLYFVPAGKEESESGYAWRAAKLRLGEIPAVLLGESWNDLKSLSALGPGFDADWEKKTAP